MRLLGWIQCYHDYRNLLKRRQGRCTGKHPLGQSTHFCSLIIDAVADHVAVVKPQLAYYEVYGTPGMEAFWNTVDYAQEKGLLVVTDAKRGDIDSTADAYATAYFGSESVEWRDAAYVNVLTINPYLGSDSIEPFVKRAEACGAGLFILVKTSNPTFGDIQDRLLAEEIKVSERVADLVNNYANKSHGDAGFSSVGVVVGSTYSKELAFFRGKLPKSLFLVPGYGAQGAGGANVTNAFNETGYGALISA